MNEEKRAAVVTGAAGGIGRATADAFLAAGYTVVGLDRAPATAAYPVIPCDIAREDDVRAAFARIEKDYGQIHVLVNAAGVFYAKNRRPVGALDAEAFRATLAINLTGTMLVTEAALPLLRRAHGDRAIVNVSSDQAEYPQPQNAAYAASKAGVNSLTRSAARELLAEKIRVNAIEASTVKTGFIAELAGSPEKEREIFAEEDAKLPLGLIPPEEIAALCLFLASPNARHVTGQCLLVDSGLYAKTL